MIQKFNGITRPGYPFPQLIIKGEPFFCDSIYKVVALISIGQLTGKVKIMGGWSRISC